MNAAPQALAEKIRARYEAFGVPASLVPHYRTSHAELLRILEAIEPRIPDTPYAVAPASFDPDVSQLRAFPRPLAWHWNSCEQTIRCFGAHGVMIRLPLFWQVEARVFDAAHAAGAFVFTNDPENMPLGAEAIRTASIDLVLTTASDAGTFSRYIHEKKASLPRTWFIIHEAGAPGWTLPSGMSETAARIAQEVHLFPGVSILEQCPHLSREKEPLFHASQSYVFETSDGKTVMTSTGDDPVPLLRYELPFTLENRGTCACGRVTVGRLSPKA